MKKSSILLPLIFGLILTGCKKEEPDFELERETVYTTTGSSVVTTEPIETGTTSETFGIVTESVTTVFVDMSQFSETLESVEETIVIAPDEDTGTPLLDRATNAIINNYSNWGNSTSLKVGIVDLNLDGIPEYVVSDMANPIVYEETETYPTKAYDLLSGMELCSFEDTYVTGLTYLNMAVPMWVNASITHFWEFDMFCQANEPLRCDGDRYYMNDTEISFDEYNEQFNTRYDFSTADASKEVVYCDEYITSADNEANWWKVRKAMDKWIVENDLFDMP